MTKSLFLLIFSAVPYASVQAQTDADSIISEAADSLPVSAIHKAASASSEQGFVSPVRIHTPEVASMMQAIDNPVGLYNGNPEISYNLYTLKDGAIEIPLTLQYNASGIKVSQEATWVGLGWNLNVGGMIVQEAVGKLDNPVAFKAEPDYYPQGEFDGYSQIPYRALDKNKHEPFFMYAREGDLQPDVFYYRFPGGSGKFYIDYRNDSIYQLSYDKPLKIDRLSNVQWKITTPDGIQYRFSGGTIAYSFSQVERAASRTWVLETALLPNGQQVSYEYTSFNHNSFSNSESQELLLQPIVGLQNYKTETTQVSTITRTEDHEFILKRIHTDNYSVDFDTESRSDYENGLRLKAIRISPNISGASPICKYSFAYSYSRSEEMGSYWQYGSQFYHEEYNRLRLQLLSVTEHGTNGEQRQILRFEYNNSHRLPPKTSYAVDYWGYYNGQTKNGSLTPSLFTLCGSSYDVSKMRGATKSANRACSTNFLSIGMLQKVHFATGGLMEYVYEPNTFTTSWKVYTDEENVQSQIHLGSPDTTLYVCNRAGETRSCTLKVPAGQLVLVSYIISRGLNSWEDMQGTSVMIFNLSKKQIMSQYKVQDTPDTDPVRGILQAASNQASTFIISINLPPELGDQSGSTGNHASVFVSVYHWTSPELPCYSIGCGLRVKATHYYEHENDTVPEKSVCYEYPEDVGSANGRLHIPLAFHRAYNNVSYGLEARTAEPYTSYTYKFATGSKEMTVNSYNLNPAPYSSIGSLVGYDKVVVRETERGKENGYTIYHFENSTEIATPGIYQLPDPRKGNLLSVDYHDANGQMLRQESYGYSMIPRHFYRGVVLTDLYNRVSGFYDTPNTGLPYQWYLINFPISQPLHDLGDFDGRYLTMLYGLRSYQRGLKSKTVTTDGVTVKEEYTTDNNGMVTGKTVTNSKGEAESYSFRYPYHFQTEPYQGMTASHILSPVVEERHSHGGSYVGGSLTPYKKVSQRFLPSASYRMITSTVPAVVTTFNGTTPTASVYPVADIEYLKYDAQGNPVDVKIRNEEVVYLWGYGYQYPVAEIRGSSYSAVKSALGMEPTAFSAQKSPDMSKVDGLRSTLPTALITTYTYRPLFGMTSMTLPNGETTYYEYDGFGRLSAVKDTNGNLLEDYLYHYR